MPTTTKKCNCSLCKPLNEEAARHENYDITLDFFLIVNHPVHGEWNFSKAPLALTERIAAYTTSDDGA